MSYTRALRYQRWPGVVLVQEVHQRAHGSVWCVVSETLFPAAVFNVTARDLSTGLGSKALQRFLALRATDDGIPFVLIQPRLDLGGQLALCIVRELLLRLLERTKQFIYHRLPSYQPAQAGFAANDP